MSVRKTLDLSFAGAGFLTMFHIGSLAAFKKASDKGSLLQLLTWK